MVAAFFCVVPICEATPDVTCSVPPPLGGSKWILPIQNVPIKAFTIELPKSCSDLEAKNLIS